MPKTIVAIIGRPNVGKSTLFNRLCGKKKAIVDDFSGVTRDRHYGESDWNGKRFQVIDTGGFVPNSDEIFEKAIGEQVEIAMSEADILLFMVDVATGITDLDEAMTNILRKTDKPIFLIVNKVDNEKRRLEATEFYSLGLGEIYLVSSVSGSGTGDLLDEVCKLIPEEEEEEKSNIPAIAIMGKPNSGKSTLINALLGEERSIVTDIAGTTRDTLRVEYNKFDKHFFLIDTAGLRKKAKVHENIEFYSVLRSIRALEDADVCILMIDAKEGIGAQDVNILRLAHKNNKGILICINKWDLLKKETNTAKEITEKIHEKIAPFTDVPVLFISALHKQRIMQAIDESIAIAERRKQQISTSKLNDLMLPIIEKYPPPATRGKYIKIKYITQLRTATPNFAFFCNHPKDINEGYKRFLENQFRANFNFSGVPINIFFRQK